MSNKVNLLFYSRNCEDCKNLLILMKNINIINKFKLICTDKLTSNIPNYIRMVPTLIVKNLNSPLEGEETFKWVKSIKYLNTERHIKNLEVNEININIDNNKKKDKKIKKINNTEKNNILDGYFITEMSGFSDKYAYTDKDDAKPHSYFDIKKNNVSIFTAPEQQKITETEQKKMINKLVEDRTKQYRNFSKIMRKQQIAAIIKEEEKKNNIKE